MQNSLLWLRPSVLEELAAFVVWACFAASCNCRTCSVSVAGGAIPAASVPGAAPACGVSQLPPGRRARFGDSDFAILSGEAEPLEEYSSSSPSEPPLSTAACRTGAMRRGGGE